MTCGAKMIGTAVCVDVFSSAAAAMENRRGNDRVSRTPRLAAILVSVPRYQGHPPVDREWPWKRLATAQPFVPILHSGPNIMADNSVTDDLLVLERNVRAARKEIQSIRKDVGAMRSMFMLKFQEIENTLKNVPGELPCLDNIRYAFESAN